MSLKRKTTVVQPGDVIGIPMMAGRRAIARVLYVSEYFKKVILLGLYDLVLERDHEFDVSNLPKQYLTPPLYTASQAIEKGRWAVLGRLPLAAVDKALSLRTVAAHVYQGDEVVRLATSEDERNLPEMLPHGIFLLEKKAAAMLKRFGIQPATIEKL